METTVGEPTDANKVRIFIFEKQTGVKMKVRGKIDFCNSSVQDKRGFFFPHLQEKFIMYLLNGTQRLTAEFALTNIDIISHLINCSAGILLLSYTKCDLDVNPNPVVSFLVQQFTLKYLSRCYNNDVEWFPSPVFV